MNHNTLVIEIKSTLDKLIAARTSLGYDYIVYGLLLINEDQTRVSNITKALYIDIAAHYETSWSCVEKTSAILSMQSGPQKTGLFSKRFSTKPILTENQQTRNFLSIYMISFFCHRKTYQLNQKKLHRQYSVLSVIINVRLSKV